MRAQLSQSWLKTESICWVSSSSTCYLGGSVFSPDHQRSSETHGTVVTAATLCYVMFSSTNVRLWNMWFNSFNSHSRCLCLRRACVHVCVPGPGVGPWAAHTRPSGCAAEASRWWAPAQGGPPADACTASSDAGTPPCTLNIHTRTHTHINIQAPTWTAWSDADMPPCTLTNTHRGHNKTSLFYC